jgi:transcriptional regulator with XRE-family HTH domain
LRPLEGVRDLRERRMLSQQELADRAGVSLFTVQRIERGEGSVRPKTGRAIAAALGVGVEDLLGKAQAPLPDFEVERREAAYEVALDAAKRQSIHTRQAANRAIESERPQAYFMHHENEALLRLLQHPKDDLADGLIEMARHVVELEAQVKAERRRVAEARRDAETARSASA